MMQWAIAQAKDKNLTALELDLEESNPATKFYERRGLSIEVETRLPEIERTHQVGRHFHMRMALT
jgi:hypothetical protein